VGKNAVMTSFRRIDDMMRDGNRGKTEKKEKMKREAKEGNGQKKELGRESRKSFTR